MPAQKRVEDIDEPTLPTLTHENEIDMQKGSTGVKREQPECVENPCKGKLRRRERIKRSLRDISPVNYEEYDTSWDLEDQSKRCKRAVNCLLAGCQCKAENEPIRNKSGVMPVHPVLDTVAELGRQGPEIWTGQYSQPWYRAPVAGLLAGTAIPLRALLQPRLVQITHQTQLVSCTAN